MRIGIPPLASGRPVLPCSRNILSGSNAGISRPQQSENTRVYAVSRLDSFWEAMVSSLLPA